MVLFSVQTSDSHMYFSYVKTMYTVGYAVSLVALTVAIAIFLLFRWGSVVFFSPSHRSWRCYLETLNMFVSLQEAALYQELHPHPDVYLVHPESHLHLHQRLSALYWWGDVPLRLLSGMGGHPLYATTTAYLWQTHKLDTKVIETCKSTRKTRESRERSHLGATLLLARS